MDGFRIRWRCSIGVWRPTYELVGDGGLLTTVQDMALWERNFVEPRLGRNPQRLIEQLTEPGRLNDGSTTEYAFGLRVKDYRGLGVVSHGGAIPGYSTFMLRFPQQRFSVQLMCNQGEISAQDLAQSVADLYLEGSFKRPVPARSQRADFRPAKPAIVTLAPGELARFAGRYYSEELDATHVIRIDGGALAAQIGYLPAEQLVPTGATSSQPRDGASISRARAATRLWGSCSILSASRACNSSGSDSARKSPFGAVDPCGHGLPTGIDPDMHRHR